jgi:hypothetical protein
MAYCLMKHTDNFTFINYQLNTSDRSLLSNILTRLVINPSKFTALELTNSMLI